MTVTYGWVQARALARLLPFTRNVGRRLARLVADTGSARQPAVTAPRRARARLLVVDVVVVVLKRADVAQVAVVGKVTDGQDRPRRLLAGQVVIAADGVKRVVGRQAHRESEIVGQAAVGSESGRVAAAAGGRALDGSRRQGLLVTRGRTRARARRRGATAYSR
jgi:hypothetical protein